MKKSNLLIAAVTLIMAACQPQVDRFAVSGTVTDAQDRVLYLERMGVDRILTVDSVRLDNDGAFRFSQPAPQGCFELYRLRIGSRALNFAVDSVQEIAVSASLSGMQTDYSIEGSASSVGIREAVIMHRRFLTELKELQQRYAGPEVGVLDQHVTELLDLFKSQLQTEIIFPNPGAPAAYFCLFLSVNGQMIFNPNANRQDAKTYAAVASSMDMLYPESDRTMHLHNLALKAMARTSSPKQVTQEQIDWLKSVIVETGLIDIELPDNTGRMQKLSDLKGKVVLLDMTAYKTDFSANYNLALRQLYDKFADRGFEIYQVSFDEDENFWINASQSIPWVSVYDERSLKSDILSLYNVDQLPVAFIIDRNGDVVERPDELSELDARIEALL
ncbi:MAG: redoxin domain-containing protein [Bacteroidaceae bacterium]|nr:redoxin domain-containing protein [Bacteroidaceae bacterium]